MINPLLDEIIFEMNNPQMSTVNKFSLRSLPNTLEVKAMADIIASVCDIIVHGSLPSLTSPPTPPINELSNCSLESDVLKTEGESDDSLVEVYYRLPTALNQAPAKDICSLDQDK